MRFLRDVFDYRQVAWLVILAAAGYFTWLAFASEGWWGGGDALVHYRMARFAWQHPLLFLDLWGKPVFTLLSAPFALFGFKAMRLFNILTALLTAWTAFDLLRRMELRNGVLAMVLILTAPIYFILIPSTLTEPLFGFVLLLAPWFMLRGKYVAGAAVVSFLPFIRSEGMFLLVFYVLFLLLNKKRNALPWLGLGTVLVWSAGLLAYGDPLWLVEQFPYHAGSIYSSGPWWHYGGMLRELWGPVLLWLSLAGSGLIVLSAISKREYGSSLFWLLLAPALAYFVMHSVLYWLQMGGSAGLARIMAPIVPVAAVLTVAFIDRIRLLIPSRHAWVWPLLLLLLSAYTVSQVARAYHLPLGLMPEERVIRKTLADHAAPTEDEAFLHYFHPFIIHELGVDPYDTARVMEGFMGRGRGIAEPGSLVYWDSHYGPQEGRTPLDSLMSDTTFVLLHQSEAQENEAFSVYIFRRE